MTHPHPKRSFVPQAVLTRSGKLSTAGVAVNTVRPINMAYKKAVNIVRPVNTANIKVVNTVRPVNTANTKAVDTKVGRSLISPYVMGFPIGSTIWALEARIDVAMAHSLWAWGPSHFGPSFPVSSAWLASLARYTKSPGLNETPRVWLLVRAFPPICPNLYVARRHWL
ncbi:hypothetical protein Tco_1397701 [Tanacetum coccineum]